jgi:hypothetical protein
MHGVLLMLIVPLEVLVHELAHAAAALRMTRGPVRVHVGQYPGLVRLRFGRLHVQLHFLPARGVNWSGICVHEPVLWPRQAAWIAAVGPVASLLCALGCTVVLRLWGPGFDPSTRIIVALGAMTAVLDAVYNGAPWLLPAVARDRPDSDGAHVRWAMGRHRILRDHERSIRRRLTRAEMLELWRTGRWPTSARRDVTSSVAPPAAG